jgi:hypothetical protein
MRSKSSDSVYGGKYYNAGKGHGGKNIKTSVNGNLKMPRLCETGDQSFKGPRKGHKKSSARKGTPMVY